MPLFDESLGHYRELAEHGLALPRRAARRARAAARTSRARGRARPRCGRFPELRAEALAPGEPAALEPAVAPALAGVRLHTGYPVGPSAATRAFAARAAAAGARLVTGAEAALAPGGVTVDGARRPAGAVVVAAGPWTPRLVDPSRRLAADRAAVGRRRRGAAGRAAAPCARGGGHRAARRARRRAAADLQPRHDRRGLGARLDVPARRSPTRRRSRRCCASAARASSPRSRTRRPAPCGRARVPSRPTACRCSAARRGATTSSSRPATGPGAISLGPASARLVADLVLGRGTGPPALFDPGPLRSCARSPRDLKQTRNLRTNDVFPAGSAPRKTRAMTHRTRRVAVLASLASLAAVPALAADPVPGSRYVGQTSQGNDSLRFEFRISDDGTRVAARVHPVPRAQVRAGPQRDPGQHPGALDRDRGRQRSSSAARRRPG